MSRSFFCNYYYIYVHTSYYGNSRVLPFSQYTHTHTHIYRLYNHLVIIIIIIIIIIIVIIIKRGEIQSERHVDHSKSQRPLQHFYISSSRVSGFVFAPFYIYLYRGVPNRRAIQPAFLSLYIYIIKLIILFFVTIILIFNLLSFMALICSYIEFDLYITSAVEQTIGRNQTLCQMKVGRPHPCSPIYSFIYIIMLIYIIMNRGETESFYR